MLNDAATNLQPLAAQMIDRLDDSRQDQRQAFADRARVAGEIDDERPAARAAVGAGEDGRLDLSYDAMRMISPSPAARARAPRGSPPV